MLFSVCLEAGQFCVVVVISLEIYIPFKSQDWPQAIPQDKVKIEISACSLGCSSVVKSGLCSQVAH
jgi:hypothetical protein